MRTSFWNRAGSYGGGVTEIATDLAEIALVSGYDQLLGHILTTEYHRKLPREISIGAMLEALRKGNYHTIMVLLQHSDPKTRSSVIENIKTFFTGPEDTLDHLSAMIDQTYTQ